MSGIKNLDKLLKSMKPKRIKGEYVFLTFSKKDYSNLKVKPLLIFEEVEGVTLIVEKKVADQNKLKSDCTWAMITLTVHSDLEAVGFLAAISNKLADAGISVNVISAYYHDHLFVPFEKVDLAMQVLKTF